MRDARAWALRRLGDRCRTGGVHGDASGVGEGEYRGVHRIDNSLLVGVESDGVQVGTDSAAGDGDHRGVRAWAGDR